MYKHLRSDLLDLPPEFWIYFAPFIGLLIDSYRVKASLWRVSMFFSGPLVSSRHPGPVQTPETDQIDFVCLSLTSSLSKNSWVADFHLLLAVATWHAPCPLWESCRNQSGTNGRVTVAPQIQAGAGFYLVLLLRSWLLSVYSCFF